MSAPALEPLKPGDLLLHVGTPKTGTSSIQFALNECRDVLASEGPFEIRYSRAGFTNKQRAHHAMGKEMFAFKPGAPLPKTEAVLADLPDPATSAAVLSAERFLGCDPQTLAREIGSRIAPEWRMRISVYLRPATGFILSAIDQTVVKGPVPVTVQTAMANMSRYYNMHERLDAFADAFDGRVSVKLFSRPELAGGNVVEDFFCDWFGQQHPATAMARGLEARNVGRNPAMILLMERARPILHGALEDIADWRDTNASRVLRLLLEALQPTADLVKPGVRLRWSREALEFFADAQTDTLKAIDARWFTQPHMLRDLGDALDATPPGTTLLSAEEATGLPASQIDAICQDAANTVERRLRQVVKRGKGFQRIG